MIRGVVSGVLLLAGAALSIGAAPQDYRKFVGQQKEFCGTVVEYTEAFNRRCDIALMIGHRAKNWKFAAVVPKSVRTALPLRPEAYLLRDVCVSGVVREEKKKPYIRVEKPEQLRLGNVSEPFASDAARDCDDGAQVPRILKEVQPEYSRAAMKARVQGVVELETLIAADGAVADVRVVRHLHADLDAAAIRSVKAWRFTSPTVHGVPTPMAVMIELTFTLR